MLFMCTQAAKYQVLNGEFPPVFRVPFRNPGWETARPGESSCIHCPRPESYTPEVMGALGVPAMADDDRLRTVSKCVPMNSPLAHECMHE